MERKKASSLLRTAGREVFFGPRVKPLRDFFRTLLLKVLGESGYSKLKYEAASRFTSDKGYSREFYEHISRCNSSVHPLFAETIFDEFKPETVVDVGCGSGDISLAFKRAGCKNVHGIDNSSAGIDMAKQRGLTSLFQIDLTKTSELPVTGDVCVCLEVAEHLPGSTAKHLCYLLSKVAPVLILSAALPGQGGHLHINEQPREFWIKLMEGFSMAYDPEALERIRHTFAGKMIPDYDRNLMVFRRVSRASKVGAR